MDELLGRVRAICAQGRKLEQSGRIAEATAAYRRAASILPNLALPQIMLAGALLAQTDLVGAKRAARKALETEPDSTATLTIMGLVLKREGKSDESEGYVRRAVAADPANRSARTLLAARLQELGNFDEAETHFAHAIVLNPGQVDAYFGIIRGRTMTPEDGPLIQRLSNLRNTRALSADDRASLHYALGKAYEDLSDYRTSMENFDEANRVCENRLHLQFLPFDREKYRQNFTDTIRAFNPNFFHGLSDLALRSSTPVFIVGMIRSGTTLVDQILSSHADIGSAGELDYWIREGREVFQGALAGQVDPLKAEQLAKGFGSRLSGFAPKARIIDKQPNNYQILGLIHALYPNARIIHCRRNALDNCLSIYTTPYLNGGPDFAHNQSNIVFAYREYERLMNHWRVVIPENRLIEIDYEDVVRDKERAARELLEFLELDWDDGCLRHEQNRRAVFTPSLWQVRQPVYQTSIGRWHRFAPFLGELKELPSMSK